MRVQAQPIAIEDVLAYLVEAASLVCEESQCFEIGGPDRVSYGDLIQEYAAQRGLRRCLVKIPLLTPWLSSLWLGLVTPLYTRIGRQLIESLKNPTIVLDDTAEDSPKHKFETYKASLKVSRVRRLADWEDLAGRVEAVAGQLAGWRQPQSPSTHRGGSSGPMYPPA